jgi:methyl-accepting chemotaxis protein
VASSADLNIAMVAGEPSGDVLAARLLSGLRPQLPHARFHGIGGEAMMAQGFESHWPMDKLTVRGLLAVIPRYREIKGIQNALRDQLLAERPAAFIGADQDYKVLLGAGVYRPGEPLPETARKDARPVMVAGKVAAYISPEGVFTPSKEEMQYMTAMREALLAGVTGAAVLALVLGVLLSKRLSRTLSSLTDAVRAMHGGSLLQRVPVHGKDEVAALACVMFGGRWLNQAVRV